MKGLKFIFLLAVLSVFCGMAAFSYSKRKSVQTAVGFVKYFGNAPVSFPGFETLEGYVYTIQVADTADFTLKDIASAQGNLLELTGTIDTSQKHGFNVLQDGVFVVSSWENLTKIP